MNDGKRSSTFDEVRTTLARAEAARQAAKTARDRAAGVIKRAVELQRRGTGRSVGAQVSASH
ncbi:hypothetical protein ACRU43_08395 [Mycobacterium colombiense]|uniref:Uncharacterized protein n=1 Tax=Mycobacterium [tuberculosis] TKK-01-0051 TaxID=1324261 RepID=A0A051UIE4_9MYCO|nr:hypothetical protein [Mycobacterium colombiense]KBZ68969.1 hypothetical protein K875_01527 [Mycobacterium [tuberculosis] TKK-01-0051]